MKLDLLFKVIKSLNTLTVASTLLKSFCNWKILDLLDLLDFLIYYLYILPMDDIYTYTFGNPISVGFKAFMFLILLMLSQKIF
jgi:hypothetical protein